MITLVDVNACVIVDSSGRTIALPVVLTQYGPLQVLVEYFVKHHRTRSISWMLKRRKAVRALLHYVSVNPGESHSARLFQNFAQALQSGTFKHDSGIDESGLCWFPKREIVAQEIVSGLTDLFDWMHTEYESDFNPNPIGHVGSFDSMLRETAYQHRREKAFLGHNWAVNVTSSTQNNGAKTKVRATTSADGEPPAFPETHIWDLLLKGFVVDGKLSYRDVLITLLLNGAGFRASEPFHLFASDIGIDPQNKDSALVLIHHPSEGGVPFHLESPLQRSNREGYLMSRYGLLPRNQLTGTNRAGWKGGKHEKIEGAKFMRANWFLPAMGELFLDIWRRYLLQISSLNRPHPFAFVNVEDGVIGEMYKLKTYRAAHARAANRIGLLCNKADGTSVHGHRHAYAQRLKKGQVEPAIRQRCMHHISIHSQEIYTQPSNTEIFEHLQYASERLRQSNDVLNKNRVTLLTMGK